MITQQAVVTKEEFCEFVLLPENRHRNFEYIAGEIVEVVSNNEMSQVSAMLLTYLGNFVRPRKLGRITGADGGYVVSSDNYVPNAAFISYARQPVRPKQVDYNSVAPDLVVEVLSPRNTASEIATKIINYMAAGTVVWLVDLETKTLDVWIPGHPVKRLRVGDALEGGDVLPGFKLAVADIFED